MRYKSLSRILPTDIKSAILYLFAKILSRSPRFIDQIYLLVGRHSLFNILKDINLTSFESKFFKTYKLLKSKDLDPYKRKTLDDERYEDVSFEKVYGLSNGGKYSVFFDQLVLYEFSNAFIYPSSDFIRLGDKAYWDKFSKPQLSMIIPGDKDLIAYDDQEVVLLKATKIINIDCGFSLFSMKMHSWGHFVSMLPKFEALKYIDEPSLEVILPSGVDAHIKEMSEILVRKHGYNKIRYVDDVSTIFFKKLYHCNAPNFLADHALIVHPSFAVIRNFSKKTIYDYASFLSKEVVISKKRKLFIARDTERNMLNYQEVESYFVDLGFDIVRPHKLSMLDKMTMFAEATHIVGPGSSGFTNMIFCRPGTKALIFHNFSRTLDLYFDLFSDHRYFDIETTIVTGADVVPGAPHCQFYIALEKIMDCVHQTRFLN